MKWIGILTQLVLWIVIARVAWGSYRHHRAVRRRRLSMATALVTGGLIRRL